MRTATDEMQDWVLSNPAELLAYKKEGVGKLESIGENIGTDSVVYGERGQDVIDYTRMSNGELIDYCADRAGRWAEAFCQVVGQKYEPLFNIDFGLMLGWFANAIEGACQHRIQTGRYIDEGGE